MPNTPNPFTDFDYAALEMRIAAHALSSPRRNPYKVDTGRFKPHGFVEYILVGRHWYRVEPDGTRERMEVR